MDIFDGGTCNQGFWILVCLSNQTKTEEENQAWLNGKNEPIATFLRNDSPIIIVLFVYFATLSM